METFFETNKAIIESYEYDEDGKVFIINVTYFFVDYIETHEIPEELAWELLTKYIPEEKLLSINGGGIEMIEDINELIDLGLINDLVVKAMFQDNFKTECAPWEEFLSFPDKMKRQHFYDCLVSVKPEERYTWHFVMQAYIFDNINIGTLYPEKLREIAVDLKKQFNPGKGDFIDVYYYDGILSFCREEDDEYKNLFLSEEQIVTALGYTIDRDKIYDTSGQYVANTSDGLEFTYRELCEVAKKYTLEFEF